MSYCRTIVFLGLFSVFAAVGIASAAITFSPRYSPSVPISGITASG